MARTEKTHAEQVYFVVCDYERGPCVYRESTDLRERCIHHGALWSHGVWAFSREQARSVVGRPFRPLPNHARSH